MSASESTSVGMIIDSSPGSIVCVLRAWLPLGQKHGSLADIGTVTAAGAFPIARDAPTGVHPIRRDGQNTLVLNEAAGSCSLLDGTILGTRMEESMIVPMQMRGFAIELMQPLMGPASFGTRAREDY